MKTTTGNQAQFSRSATVNAPRSAFNRSCGRKTTMDAGNLVPIFCEEVLPGDTINLSVAHFARLATPLKPLMDNMFLDMQFFFVPNRLIWSQWPKFNGEQTDPGDSTDFLIPVVSGGSVGMPNPAYVAESLFDYFGLPIGIEGLEHSSLPFRAYNLIYDEWYRDQNLQDTVMAPLMLFTDGPDAIATFLVRKRGKRHDYFSSCLPFPQKGDAVTIGIGGTAPVVLDTGQTLDIDPEGVGMPTFNMSGITRNLTSQANVTPVHWSGTGSVADSTVTWVDPALSVSMDGVDGTADLSSATAATVNQLREAFQMQKLLERDARGGTRYTEIIRSHFGVTSPDARLQRPEYLGGGTTMISANPVASTYQAAGGSDDPQGNLTAYATSSSGRSASFVHSFVEHGQVIGLASVRADLNYQQGIPRQFSRRTRHDFYWPAFAHLGEQAVLNKEIWAAGKHAAPDTDDLVFGYQERWAEMRYKPSEITGKFRSADPQSLDFWHLAQDFATLPLLNDEFIEEDPPVDRVIAVPSEPHLIMDMYFTFKHVRPLPTYSVPGLIDHF